MLKVTVRRPPFVRILVGALLVCGVAPGQPAAARNAGPPPVANVVKWSPPVLELLVDPWARAKGGAAGRELRWLPPRAEIVDPWGEDARAEVPRVASEQASPARSTIF